MTVRPIPISWHPGLPVFARESFLKAVGDEVGWLGGFSESGALRCILPYTIIRKMIFRMVRFRTATIPLAEEFPLDDEKSFLNAAMAYFRSLGADLVIPASNNAIFRTYPDRAEAAPYGTYLLDLGQSEESLWRNLDSKLRQNIRTAQKSGITIRDGSEDLEAAHAAIRATFRKSRLPFMDLASFRRFMGGLGEGGRILFAEHQGAVQSYVVFAFSPYSAYAIYAGNVAQQAPGSIKFLIWEAIRAFRQLGVQRFDFMGARIGPERGSKQEALSFFKKRFGATLREGYLWKYSFHPLKYRLYGIAARLRSGGDIVDAERHKLEIR